MLFIRFVMNIENMVFYYKFGNFLFIMKSKYFGMFFIYKLWILYFNIDNVFDSNWYSYV